MVLITELVPNARRAGRYDVAVSGGQYVTVGSEAVARLRLASGRELDEDGLATLIEEGEVTVAIDRALDALALRERSAMELRRLLRRKGVADHVARIAVGRLEEGGLVDDSRYARALARSRALGAGAARRRIEQELARKGVARSVADEAIAEVWAEEEVDQGEMALALARKRYRTLSGLDPAVRERRLYGYLARRGYGPDDIKRALDALRGEAEE